MVNFFQSVLGFLESIVQIVINLYQGLYTMVSLIPQSTQMLFDTVSVIPAELTVFAVAGIAACICFFIIGR